MINSNAISALSNFTPGPSDTQAYQWGQMAFSQDERHGNSPQHDDDLIASVSLGDTLESLSFAAGYVQAYLKAQQLA